MFKCLTLYIWEHIDRCWSPQVTSGTLIFLGINQTGYDLMKFFNDRVPGNVTTVKIQFLPG